MPEPDECFAFSDESQHSDGRYRSIGVVTAPANHVDQANESLRVLCAGRRIRELGWKHLDEGRHRHAVCCVLDHLFTELLPAGVRVTVLVWDTQDSRHAVVGRDDRANFERMFFHLHKQVMGRSKPGAHWHLRPDRRSDLDWSTTHETLGHAGSKRWAVATPLLPGVPLNPKFIVRSFDPVDSAEVPLCQLADVFAGLAVFTRTKADTVRTWMAERGGQQTLFGGAALQLSKSDRERLPVVAHLYDHCTRTRQGVSLMTKGYLHSPGPGCAVSFWHYEPQRFADRAPVKGAQR